MRPSRSRLLAAGLCLVACSGALRANTYLDEGSHQPRTTQQVSAEDLHRPPFDAVLKLKAFDPASHGHHWLDCTAFAAQDRHIVVTAAHCLIERGQLRAHPKLYTEYHDGSYREAFEAGVVWLGMTDWRKEPERDVAVLYVPMGLPDRVRPLEITRDIAEAYRHKVQAAGYSQHVDEGERLSFDPACRLHEENEGAWPGHDMIFHDCNLTEVASGAPLLRQGRNGRYAVLGIHVGEYQGDGSQSQRDVPYELETTNFGVKAAVFDDAVRALAAKIRRHEAIAVLTSLP